MILGMTTSTFTLVRIVLSLVGIASGLVVTYVVSAVTALYLNVFVGVVQAFRRVPALKLAPHQTGPPFLVTQLAVLVIFIVITILAAKRFRDEPVRAAARAA